MIILLVEDNDMVRRSTERTLRIHGHSVESVQDGQEALAKIESGFRPDAIISDLEMPNLNGDELCMWLRRFEKDRSFSHISFLLMSGRDDIAKVAARCGATRFAHKGSKELIDVMRAFIDG